MAPAAAAAAFVVPAPVGASAFVLLPADTCSLCKIFALPDKRQGIVVTLHPSTSPSLSPSGELHCRHFMADNLMPGKAEKQESDVAQLKACAKRQWQRFSLRHANLIGLRTYIHTAHTHRQAHTDIFICLSSPLTVDVTT